MITGLVVDLVESVESQYINVSTFRPFIGSSYIKLLVELKNSKKELINVKNNDQKYFVWCHIKHINPVKIHSERITQNNKKLINNLDMKGLNFPCQTKYVSFFFVMKTL